MLQIENCSPAQYDSSEKSFVYFEVVDTDTSGTLGFIDPASIDISIKTTGDYFGVVSNGVVDEDYPSYLVWEIECFTGAHITGDCITGRTYKRFKFKYSLHENLYDGYRIYVHVTCSDMDGNSLDETFWVELAEWVYTDLPKVSIEYDSNDVTTLEIPYHEVPGSDSLIFYVYWGKDCITGTGSPETNTSIDFLLDHIYISLTGADSDATGGQLLDGGCVSINGTTVSNNQEVDLGAFEVGEYVQVTLNLDTTTYVTTYGPIAFNITFRMVRPAITGSFITGCEITGGYVEIGNFFGLQNSHILVINLRDSSIENYQSLHGLTWN